MRNRKEVNFPDDGGDLHMEPHNRLSDRKNKKAGRGTNANYLLNISFAERQSIQDDFEDYEDVVQPDFKPYSKTRFVNANFRFIIRRADHNERKVMDPDHYIAWTDIEQVLVRPATYPSCPICLSAPTAARVAPCGHIFCLPCMVRYFEIGEGKLRDCPICLDFLYLDDLKGVRLLSGEKPLVGKPQDLCLIHRTGESMLALPHPYLDTKLPSTRTADALEFARCMVSCPTYMESECRRDQRELEHALTEAQETEEWEDVSSISSALEMVKQRINEIEKEKAGHPAEHKHRHPQHRDNRSDAGGSKKDMESGESAVVEYYFMQAADGQYVFLMPLDIRILKHEFGEYANFPKKLSLPVVSFEEITMTKETRKRHKYLGHLPLGCDVVLIATDLSTTVSKETLDAFKDELSLRRLSAIETISEDILDDEEASLAYALKLSAALNGGGA